jgi:arylsulfatase A-like enzyme
MSGQYGVRTGMYTVGSPDRFDWRSRPLRPVDNVTEMPFDRILLPLAIKSGGYATAIFGKWHLGDQGKFHPLERGFDEGFVTEGKHFDFETNPPQSVPQGAYLADYLTDRAADFIRRHKDAPFFLYLPHFAIHAPLQAKPELIQRFQAKPKVGGHQDPTYAAMIFSVDEGVGRIRQLLQELNLQDKTLIIFTSDNGGVGGYQREGINSGYEHTDNTPLRGGKGMLYEGGIRVPYIACWPGTVPAGAESEQPITGVDLYPTLLDVAGIAAPSGTVLDGTSYLGILKGEKQTSERRPLYWHFPGYLGGVDKNNWRTTPAGAIRFGDWKLIEFFEDNRQELYNLRSDLGEKQNLAVSQPGRLESLSQMLHEWRKQTNAPMPTKNSN